MFFPSPKNWTTSNTNYFPLNSTLLLKINCNNALNRNIRLTSWQQYINYRQLCPSVNPVVTDPPQPYPSTHSNSTTTYKTNRQLLRKKMIYAYLVVDSKGCNLHCHGNNVNSGIDQCWFELLLEINELFGPGKQECTSFTLKRSTE